MIDKKIKKSVLPLTTFIQSISSVPVTMIAKAKSIQVGPANKTSSDAINNADDRLFTDLERELNDELNKKVEQYNTLLQYYKTNEDIIKNMIQYNDVVVHSLRRKCNDLKQVLDEKSKNIKDLNETLSKYNYNKALEISDMNSEIELLQERDKSNQQLISSLRLRVDDLTTKAEIARAMKYKVDELESKINAMNEDRNEILKLHKVIEELEVKNKALENQLSMYKSQINDLQSQNNTLINKASALESELNSLRKSISEDGGDSARVIELSKQITKVRELTKRVNSEPREVLLANDVIVSSLRHSLSIAHEEIKQLRNQIKLHPLPSLAKAEQVKLVKTEVAHPRELGNTAKSSPTQTSKTNDTQSAAAVTPLAATTETVANSSPIPEGTTHLVKTLRNAMKLMLSSKL